MNKNEAILRTCRFYLGKENEPKARKSILCSKAKPKTQKQKEIERKEKMSSCKDCVHYEVCESEIEAHHDNPRDLEVDGIEEHCGFFKPKSRFVELPCEVGDKVYRIANDGKTITEERIGEVHLEFTIDDGTGWHNVWWLKEYNIGVTTFLTKEEAELALQRKEDEGK